MFTIIFVVVIVLISLVVVSEIKPLCEYVLIITALLNLYRIQIQPRLIVILTVIFTLLYKNSIITFLHVCKIVIYPILTRKKNDIVLQAHVQSMLSSVMTIKHNFSKLPSTPSIIVVNYPCTYIDCFASMLIPKRISIVMADRCSTKLTWGVLLEDIILRKKKYGNSYEDVKNQIQKAIQKGRSVLAYVTTYTFHTDKRIYIGRVRTGMFRIAQELGVPITPIAFDYVKQNLGRIDNQNFQICVGETFNVTDPVKSSYKVNKFYRTKLSKFMNEKHSFLETESI